MIEIHLAQGHVSARTLVLGDAGVEQYDALGLGKDDTLKNLVQKLLDDGVPDHEVHVHSYPERVRTTVMLSDLVKPDQDQNQNQQQPNAHARAQVAELASPSSTLTIHLARNGQYADCTIADPTLGDIGYGDVGIDTAHTLQALARQLIKAGVEDAPVEVFTGNQLVMTFPSLYQRFGA